MGYAEQLDRRLREIEAAAAAFDEGDGTASARASGDLSAVFQAVPSLLSHLGATYVKVVSCVPKPPFPGGKFAPLTEVVMELGAGDFGSSTGQAGGFPPPRFQARLGPTRGLRSVQAPDWWKSEPVFLVDHSRVTRRDVVSAAAGETDGGGARLSDLLIKAGWIGMAATPYGDVARTVPLGQAAAAAVRQIAHEVLHSPDLLKLAGRPVKP